MQSSTKRLMAAALTLCLLVGGFPTVFASAPKDDPGKGWRLTRCKDGAWKIVFEGPQRVLACEDSAWASLRRRLNDDRQPSPTITSPGQSSPIADAPTVPLI